MKRKLRFQVLREIIEHRGYLCGVELGLHRGETFSYLLRNCPSISLVGVDLFTPDPEGKVQTYKNWSHNYNERCVRRIVSSYPDRARLLKMDTVEASMFFEDGEFDFVFVDADHSVMGAFRDILAWWPRLKNSGAMLGHDYNWGSVGYVVDNLFERVKLHDDNVWEGSKIRSRWQPDPNEAQVIDHETRKWHLKRSVSPYRAGIRRGVRIPPEKYAIKTPK